MFITLAIIGAGFLITLFVRANHLHERSFYFKFRSEVKRPKQLQKQIGQKWTVPNTKYARTLSKNKLAVLLLRRIEYFRMLKHISDDSYWQLDLDNLELAAPTALVSKSHLFSVGNKSRRMNRYFQTINYIPPQISRVGSWLRGLAMRIRSSLLIILFISKSSEPLQEIDGSQFISSDSLFNERSDPAVILRKINREIA